MGTPRPKLLRGVARHQARCLPVRTHHPRCHPPPPPHHHHRHRHHVLAVYSYLPASASGWASRCRRGARRTHTPGSGSACPVARAMSDGAVSSSGRSCGRSVSALRRRILCRRAAGMRREPISSRHARSRWTWMHWTQPSSAQTAFNGPFSCGISVVRGGSRFGLTLWATLRSPSFTWQVARGLLHERGRGRPGRHAALRPAAPLHSGRGGRGLGRSRGRTTQLRPQHLQLLYCCCGGDAGGGL
jgi:hypothetical protein